MDIQAIIVKSFQTLIEQFSAFIPRFLGCLILILIGWGVTKLVTLIVGNVLKKVGIDALGEQLKKVAIINQVAPTLKVSAVLTQIIGFFIIIVFVSAAVETLGVSALIQLVNMLVLLLPKLLSAAIMLLIGTLVADAVKNFITKLCLSFGIQAGKLIGTAVFFFIFLIILIAALGQIGVNTQLLESSFNWLVGGIIIAFGAGYGFASKDILANILSSFYLKNKYREGQTIAINGTKGQIVALDATSVTLQTGQSQVVFPLQLLQTTSVEIFE